MPSVTVTTTPQQFHVLAGITDVSRVVWTGRMQNAGPVEAILFDESNTAPSISDPAFKRVPGEEWEMTITAGTLPATWFWTKRGTATLVFRNA